MEKKIYNIFKKSLEKFIEFERDNILFGINERNLCGRLTIYLQEKISHSKFLKGYFADPEHNRMQEGKIKTILDGDMNEVTINCDIIIHSRGQNIEQDNLLAIEMKKSTAPESEKEKDKTRLKALTKKSYDDIWSADGKVHPKYVCGYILGVYIEIDSKLRNIQIEYYKNGGKIGNENYNF